MAFVVPFHGLRFNPAKVERLEEVVTPPYDVIDPKTEAAYAARHPYNMIQLDISKDPGSGEEREDRYLRAREHFDRWRAEGVLIRDAEPAIYLYYIEYSLPSGRRLTRKGLVAQVRLAEFSEGVVLPHEETFGTVTTDRLRLMETCRAQFSQIFSLYSDAGNRIAGILGEAGPSEPLYDLRDPDGSRHRLWRVTDSAVQARVHDFFQDKTLYIADGHHRYTTALNFRRMMAEKEGGLPEDSPFHFTMMYLCAMEDPGLTVLPTHRLLLVPPDRQAVLPGLPDLLAALAESFEEEEISGSSREALIDEALYRLAEADDSVRSRFGLYHAETDRCFLLTLREDAQPAEETRPAALQDLDVVVLSDLVVGHYLGLDHESCETENLVRYFSDPYEALDVAVKESCDDRSFEPLLFLMNNTQVEQIRRVADEGLTMPHKSTYFYPKILTGLVMNHYVPEERPGI